MDQRQASRNLLLIRISINHFKLAFLGRHQHPLQQVSYALHYTTYITLHTLYSHSDSDYSLPASINHALSRPHSYSTSLTVTVLSATIKHTLDVVV